MIVQDGIGNDFRVRIGIRSDISSGAVGNRTNNLKPGLPNCVRHDSFRSRFSTLWHNQSPPFTDG